MATTAQITVPITLELTTRDANAEVAYARAKAFLTERLLALADVSAPGVYWAGWGDVVRVRWGSGRIEVVDDGLGAQTGAMAPPPVPRAIFTPLRTHRVLALRSRGPLRLA